MRTRVAVIGGGQSCEHDVSLASAASVVGALDPATYDVVPLTIDRDGTWRDRGLRPIGLCGAAQVLRGCDVAFPMVHGPRGEDGALAALCELAGIAYVGSRVRPGAIAMDKWATKLVAGAVGIATAPGHLVTSATAAHQRWTHQVVVKPVAAGSSLGVTLVTEANALQPALKAAHDVLDHDAKYGGQADLRVPARVDEVDAKALEDAALAAYDALGCAGVARVDFFLTEQGPVLNEVNTVPGMTEHSQVPRMFAAAGMSYPELLDELVRGARR